MFMNSDVRKNKDAEEKTESLSKALRRIYSLSRPYRVWLYTSVILTVLASLVWLVIPLGLRSLLDAVFQKGNRHLLNLITLGLLALFILRAVLSQVGDYWLEWVGERVVTDLRKRLYEHLHRLGFIFFSNTRLGEITSRLTNDVSSIRSAVTDSLPELLTQGFSLVGSVALMVMLNWRLSAVVFLTVPGISIGTRYFGSKIRKLSRSVQDRLADTTAVAEETLGAIRVVKAFAREKFEVIRYHNAAEDLFETARRRIFITTLFWSAVGMLFMMSLVVIFWYGGVEVLAGRLTAGDMVAFIFYAFNISRSIGVLSRLYTVFNTATGASERIFELLDQEPEIQDLPDAVTLPPVEGRILFRHVSFAYDKVHPVLRNIDLEVQPGETIAIVGPSGAGKTTLIHLVPRFFDPTSGLIAVDGFDIRTVTAISLREQIALVPQDIHLFGSTIRENIRYGKLEAGNGEIEKAASAANAMEFIEKLPEGFDSRIGEKGVKLSGGQRQRISIARALLKNPPILLMDEATSSLDSESEMLVQKAMQMLLRNRTTFIIAHRLSTVRNATRIVVMDDGRIIQVGTHDDLMAREGLYRHLYELQFAETGKGENPLVNNP